MMLKGKVAVISGAGRGLGRATAIAMAREGASVTIFSRTEDELREVEESIRSMNGRVAAMRGDAARGEDLHRVVAMALERFGRIDILMNNAGVVGPIGHFEKVELSQWDETFRINLRSAFILSKRVIPHMRKVGGGKIINVTSGLGEMVMPPFGVYSVTKAGLIHFTKILAEELREANIQVNGLDPGVVETAMQDRIQALGPEILGEVLFHEFQGMKQAGALKSPEQVARLALFLASAESDGITGMVGTEGDFRPFGYGG